MTARRKPAPETRWHRRQRRRWWQGFDAGLAVGLGIMVLAVAGVIWSYPVTP